MKGFGYKQAMTNLTLFFKRDGDDITLIIVYVDDMTVIGSSPKEVEKIWSHLAKEFEMKDLGTLKYFLGIEFLVQSMDFSSHNGSIHYIF